MEKHGHGSIFSSKKDQIMSKYSPIATKPSTIPGEFHSNLIAMNSQFEKELMVLRALLAILELVREPHIRLMGKRWKGVLSIPMGSVMRKQGI